MFFNNEINSIDKKDKDNNKKKGNDKDNYNDKDKDIENISNSK